jgi:1-deoxy-D-xylulose-5-phosphate reductoisomerase
MNTTGLAVLGSTGSIGRQTLDVVRSNPGRFHIAALSARANVALLLEQINEFQPELAVVGDETAAAELRQAVGGRLRVESGRGGLCAAASLEGVHTVVDAVVGFEGLFPALAAISSGKDLALANKESLAAGGPLLREALAHSSSELFPVDSEHSSIYQCLNRRGRPESVRRVFLTASGGPFLHLPLEQFADVRPEDAIRHPRWNMGPKISVDSATLMNKGLEVIEASMLFQLPGEKIHVLIHPESVVHGLVEYDEGTQLAALFSTDMRVPIAYALKCASSSGSAVSLSSGVSFLDLAAQGTLHFFAPDMKRFPALALCYQALEEGGTAPAVLNAANEIAVENFLHRQLPFSAIVQVVERTLQVHEVRKIKCIEDVISTDAEARACASKLCEEYVSEIV